MYAKWILLAAGVAIAGPAQALGRGSTGEDQTWPIPLLPTTSATAVQINRRVQLRVPSDAFVNTASIMLTGELTVPRMNQAVPTVQAWIAFDRSRPQDLSPVPVELDVAGPASVRIVVRYLTTPNDSEPREALVTVNYGSGVALDASGSRITEAICEDRIMLDGENRTVRFVISRPASRPGRVREIAQLISQSGRPEFSFAGFVDPAMIIPSAVLGYPNNVIYVGPGLSLHMRAAAPGALATDASGSYEILGMRRENRRLRCRTLGSF